MLIQCKSPDDKRTFAFVYCFLELDIMLCYSPIVAGTGSGVIGGCNHVEPGHILSVLSQDLVFQ